MVPDVPPKRVARAQIAPSVLSAIACMHVCVRRRASLFRTNDCVFSFVYRTCTNCDVHIVALSTFVARIAIVRCRPQSVSLHRLGSFCCACWGSHRSEQMLSGESLADVFARVGRQAAAVPLAMATEVTGSGAGSSSDDLVRLPPTEVVVTDLSKQIEEEEQEVRLADDRRGPCAVP